MDYHNGWHIEFYPSTNASLVIVQVGNNEREYDSVGAWHPGDNPIFSLEEFNDFPQIFVQLFNPDEGQVYAALMWSSICQKQFSFHSMYENCYITKK